MDDMQHDVSACVWCSFVFEFGIFCTSFARSHPPPPPRSHGWAVERTFSSPPLAAFCQNPLNAEPTSASGVIVILAARLRDILCRSSAPTIGRRYPGLICAQGRRSSRVVVYPIRPSTHCCDFAHRRRRRR